MAYLRPETLHPGGYSIPRYSVLEADVMTTRYATPPKQRLKNPEFLGFNLIYQQSSGEPQSRLARWFVFKPKIGIWVNCGGP
jgi:hypothetical protein